MLPPLEYFWSSNFHLVDEQGKLRATQNVSVPTHIFMGMEEAHLRLSLGMLFVRDALAPVA
jgi:hypothetical protein